MIIALGVAALIGIFWATAASATHLWATTSAYNYGYLIVPIALYVAWGDRAQFASTLPEPSLWGVALTGAFAVLWLMSDLMSINEGRQFALVGMIQGLFLAVLGLGIYRALSFPLLYLFLMVPTGEFLLSPLQTFAHHGAVVLLHASDIPVFVEGMLIQVPHGIFLVEPGCAGLNFVLASLALSLLYGKLTYRRTLTRILCVAVAIIVSILSNVARIYLIVAITEWSHRRIGIADDHLLYGWGFFAVIMLLMMWLGARVGEPASANVTPVLTNGRPDQGWRDRVVAAGLTLTVAAIAIGVASMTAGAENSAPMMVALPSSLGDWSRITATDTTPWTPGVVSGDGSAQASYAVGPDHRVDLAVVVYRAQHDGRHAAAAGNTSTDNKNWEELSQSDAQVTIGGRPFHTTLALVRSGSRERLVLTWYVSSGCVTGSRLTARLCAGRTRIMGRPAPGAFIAMSTELLAPSGMAAKSILIDAASRLDLTAILAQNARAGVS